jgi:hypothetical protein
VAQLPIPTLSSSLRRARAPRLPSPSPPPRAAALAVALLLLALPWQATAGGAQAEHEFVGAKKCQTCHKKEKIGNQYGIWLESRHAKAFETLAGEKAAKWAADAGVDDPQSDERCVKCHVTAYGVPDERVSMKFDRSAGVQCEACHGAGKDYRKKKIMIDRELAESKGLIPQSEKVCTPCHNDQSPAWNPEKYTLPDGAKVGFDYEQAVEEIAHPVPEDYDPTAEGKAD